jgi:hopanoid biosynthesis associated radical SAM protein HpnH
MSVPISQMWTVATYVLGKKLRGVKQYPLILMLEPLFRCNLACAGCGKIQYPADILRKNLSPEECFRAAEECGAPIVSIPGGEPLLHPQIAEIAAGLVARKRYVYLCTNAIKLEEALPQFTPSKYLAFSVHLDGLQPEHDRAVCRDGVFEVAIQAIKAAKARGFRVTTNTTLYLGAEPARVQAMFDELMALGVEGMMVSPGYGYEKAPDQEHFLHRRETESLFRAVLRNGKRAWKFNQTPLFLEFLKGNYRLDCTPWGSPTYNVFGWQKPCYLLGEGYAQTFEELMATTAWSRYGHASGNPKCGDCMVHCGFEPSAVEATFGSWRGFARTAWLTLFGAGRPRESAPVRSPPHCNPAPASLVQLHVTLPARDEAEITSKP